MREVDRMAETLARRAFAEEAGWRERLVLVTSAGEGEGKSFCAIQLALGLLRRPGCSVLLLGAAAPGRSALDQLGLSAADGLGDLLGAKGRPAADVVHETDFAGLAFVAPGGATAPSDDHFASRRMVEVLRSLALREPRSLVVIDAPALRQGSRAAVLAVIAAQVVLVVQAGATRRSAVGQALDTLRGSKRLLLLLNHGPVLSGAEQRGRWLDLLLAWLARAKELLGRAAAPQQPPPHPQRRRGRRTRPVAQLTVLFLWLGMLLSSLGRSGPL